MLCKRATQNAHRLTWPSSLPRPCYGKVWPKMYVFEGLGYSWTTWEERVEGQMGRNIFLKVFGFFQFLFGGKHYPGFCSSNAGFSNASLREEGNKRSWQKWKWNNLVSSSHEPKMNSIVVKSKLILNIFYLIVVGMYKLNYFLEFEVRWCLVWPHAGVFQSDYFSTKSQELS